MNLESALEKLFSLHQFGVKLGLENITGLLSHIGNPQKDLKAIHIAGSNGKGSTASFIASMLQEAGYKTGLFTSPHLVVFNERIRINGEMIPDDYVCEFMNDVDGYIDEYSPTFFELTTAMAFKYFADNKVDYAVVETGLGGRLDATNVLDPIASVITSISFEHTHILGDTLDKIAGEKAGIFKGNGNVFLAELPYLAETVFVSKASELDCKLWKLADFTESFHDLEILKLNSTSLNIYSTPLPGRFQLSNSALAALVIFKIIDGFDTSHILRGINNVVENTGVAGRYEVYSETPKIIFDAAHNSESIDAFISEFKNEYKLYDRCNLIIGMMQDKNIEEAIKKLSPFFDNIYATSIDYERAAKIEDLIAAGHRTGTTLLPLPDAAEFINNFKKQSNNECLVILGSIYVIGEIKFKLVRN